MTVFALTEELRFPNPELADEEGVLALGGDLSADRLLLAYRQGIFPWYSDGQPIIWWSPDPRCILQIGDLKVSKSMRPILNQERYRITYDQAFEAVISHCREIPRPGQRGTWITTEMLLAYLRLHKMGYAHSVEAWQGNDLVGGLYGISLGRCFFGESMFSIAANASKAALIIAAHRMQEFGFSWIDCQVYNDHMGSLGAIEISRSEFLERLEKDLAHADLVGDWSNVMGKVSEN